MPLLTHTHPHSQVSALVAPPPMGTLPAPRESISLDPHSHLGRAGPELLATFWVREEGRSGEAATCLWPAASSVQGQAQAF